MGEGKGFEIRLDSTTYNHRYLKSQLCRMNRHISSLAMRMLQKPFQKTPSRVCPPQGDPANCRKRKGHASWLYRSIRLIFLGLQVSWARAPREELAPSHNLNTCNSSFYLEFYQDPSILETVGGKSSDAHIDMFGIRRTFGPGSGFRVDSLW